MTDTQTEAKRIQSRMVWRGAYGHLVRGEWFAPEDIDCLNDLVDYWNERDGPGTHWLETDEQQHKKLTLVIALERADPEARLHFPRSEPLGGGVSGIAATAFESEFSSKVSKKCTENVFKLMKRLPKELLDQDLEFGVTEDGYATLTWYREESIAALSVGEEPSLYFSTVNKNGQKTRGCKSFDKFNFVVGAIRDA